MGQFKPMVKMYTTEPSVELKLKKGGHVSMKAKAEHGHKPMRKLDGGVMGALARTPALVGRPAVQAPVRTPGKPSMAARRMAMAGRRPMATPIMKEGGKADVAQDKAMIKKAMAQHDAQEHKGGKGTKLKLKSGGVTMGQGGYKEGGIIKSEKGVGPYNTTKMDTAKVDHSPASTGGVGMGKPGGYKRGGKIQHKAKGGVMNYVEGNVVGTPKGVTNTTTGSVKKGNAGGYKKGGAPKKFADGGRVQDDGRPVAMPQGHKKPTPPVSISRLSGTFKKGGSVRHKYTGGNMDSQTARETKGYEDHYAREAAENRAMSEAMNPMTYIRPLAEKVKGMFTSPAKPAGSVTKTEKSVTVTPASRRKGGKAMC
jgi:hypothetical protein